MIPETPPELTALFNSVIATTHFTVLESYQRRSSGHTLWRRIGITSHRTALTPNSIRCKACQAVARRPRLTLESHISRSFWMYGTTPNNIAVFLLRGRQVLELLRQHGFTKFSGNLGNLDEDEVAEALELCGHARNVDTVLEHVQAGLNSYATPLRISGTMVGFNRVCESCEDFSRAFYLTAQVEDSGTGDSICHTKIMLSTDECAVINQVAKTLGCPASSLTTFWTRHLKNFPKQ